MDAMASCNGLSVFLSQKSTTLDVKMNNFSATSSEKYRQNLQTFRYGFHGPQLRQLSLGTKRRKHSFSINCTAQGGGTESEASSIQSGELEDSGGDVNQAGPGETQETGNDGEAKVKFNAKSTTNGTRPGLSGTALKHGNGWQLDEVKGLKDNVGGWSLPIELDKKMVELPVLSRLPEAIAAIVFGVSIAVVSYTAYSRRGMHDLRLQPDAPAVMVESNQTTAVPLSREGDPSKLLSPQSQSDKLEASEQPREAAKTGESANAEAESQEAETISSQKKDVVVVQQKDTYEPGATENSVVNEDKKSSAKMDGPNGLQQEEDQDLDNELDFSQLMPWSNVIEAVSEEADVEEPAVESNVEAPPEQVVEEVSENELAESEPVLDQFPLRGVSAPAPVSSGFEGKIAKVVVAATVDPLQSQAVEALQALKVVETDIDPAGICTRREYARWIVSASTVLSRNPGDRIFPSMFVESLTELAFDDVLPEDSDFPAIQGLAEAGLISSSLSHIDLGCDVNPNKPGCSDTPSSLFHPDSPVTRQDLISWKVALENRNLGPVDAEVLNKVSCFLDIKRIDRDALPAVAYDLSQGERSIISATFGYTRRFEPLKPVTRAQAACALALGESAELVGEELERISFEKIAEDAVRAADEAEAAEIRAEQELVDIAKAEANEERLKREEAEKAVEAVRQELQQAQKERQEERDSIVETKAAVETERKLLEESKRIAAEQATVLSSNKKSLEKERELLERLKATAEAEKKSMTQMKADVEAERGALVQARTQAEEEARRAAEEAKRLATVRRKLQGNSEVSEEVIVKISSPKVSPFPKWPDEPSDSLQNKGEGEKVASTFKAEGIFRRGIELQKTAVEAAENAVGIAGNVVENVIRGAEEVAGGAREKAKNVASSLANGTKKAVQDVRGGVEQLVQRFKES